MRRYPDAAQVSAVQDAVARLASGSPVRFPAVREALEGLAATKIKVAIKLLADAGVMRRVPGGGVAMSGAPLPWEKVQELAGRYAERSEKDREKLERMVFYAQTGICRWRVLLDYFGEKLENDRCGTCDNCRRAARAAQPPSPDPLRVPARPPRRREYATGDMVRVPRYGEGRVRSAAGDEITVEFPNGETRTFLRSYVRRVRSGTAHEATPVAG